MANSETLPVIMYDPAPSFYRGVFGSASGSVAVPGVFEMGTGTGSAFALDSAPYFGARVDIFIAGSGTAGRTVITNASTVTLNNQGDRTITFLGEGQSVSLLGVSTTRWHIMHMAGATSA